MRCNVRKLQIRSIEHRYVLHVKYLAFCALVIVASVERRLVLAHSSSAGRWSFLQHQGEAIAVPSRQILLLLCCGRSTVEDRVR